MGDIVLVRESGKIKGKWKLGKVVKADASERDGLVRQVDVSYKNPNLKAITVITRPVQQVVVVHPADADSRAEEPGTVVRGDETVGRDVDDSGA
jgi:hypothetical protein